MAVYKTGARLKVTDRQHSAERPIMIEIQPGIATMGFKAVEASELAIELVKRIAGLDHQLALDTLTAASKHI